MSIMSFNKRVLEPFFLLVFLTPLILFGTTLNDKIKDIPRSEVEKMRNFFDYALIIESAGHALYFESKPVSLICFWLDEDCDKNFREGWYAFRKYEHLFPHNNFIIEL